MEVSPTLSFLWSAVFATHTAFSASSEDWKSRTIFQVLTDRYSKTQDTTQGCSNLQNYCGGTFQGIINHLDYIQGMGFDAIWISPVVTNTKGGYHGYWAQDLYSVNSYFGSESDLKDLRSALNEREMYLMIDVVANHMGNPPNGYNDMSMFTPFNQTNDYHGCGECPPSCNIEDWNDQNQIEQCRLSGLPDLDQSNTFVNKSLCDWVRNYIVGEYKADGLRVDTVPEIAPNPFWSDFVESAGVYAVGEVFNGDSAYVGPYQEYLPGLLNYPMYYCIRNAFGSRQSMSGNLQGCDYNNRQHFKDINLLGNFVDNHDNDRFLCDYSDNSGQYRSYQNALVFTLTYPGIPIIYYGTEQAYGGCASYDHNRETLWVSNWDTQSTLYQFLKSVIHARKALQIWKYDWSVKYSGNGYDLFAYTRGDQFLVLLTNAGSNGAQHSASFNPGLQSGQQYCNVFWPTEDCFTFNGGNHQFYLDSGESKIYVPQKYLI